MKVECTQCHHQTDVPDDRLKAYGYSISFPCLNCGSIINLHIKSRTGDTSDDSTGSPAADEHPMDTASLKQQVLNTVKDLPPMPQVAEKARKLTADPDSGFSDLAKLIETDQAIVARVLKMANSAFYGAVGKIASVRQASVVLGLKTLNELLTLACASEVMNQPLKGYGLKPEEMWKHSLAVAAGSRIIAEKYCPLKADDVFSAGLIHDAGKLILDPYVFDRGKTLDRSLEKNDPSFFMAEKEVLGFDHAETGSAVCQMWRIPGEIATAIRYHHEPSLSPEKDLAYVICAADMIAHDIHAEAEANRSENTIYREALDFLSLKKEDLQSIGNQVKGFTDRIVS